jgi:2,4-diaminopentanoate dehydrogenase
MTGRTSVRYPVVHIGTGLTGSEALRATILDPALELVGVHVSTPSKVGTDAGQLCGVGDVGVTATSDMAEIVALKPDCVSYCATAVRREDDAIADIAALLEAGINVVTISTIPMVYPPAAPQRWRDVLGSAAQKGNSTFYATGSEPGFISLNLPTALLSGAGTLDSYRMDEYAVDLDKSYPIWDVLHESMGFGKPDGHIPARIASGKVNHDWETVVRYLADVLGIELDRIELDWETVLAPVDLPTAVGVLPSGTVCGHRWQLSGVVDDRKVVAVQYFATVSSTPWPQRWPKPSREGQGGMVFRVDGDPSMSLELYLEPSKENRVNPGITATAMAAVNAIPSVVVAAPGVIEVPLAGPEIISRLATPGLLRRQPRSPLP